MNKKNFKEGGLKLKIIRTSIYTMYQGKCDKLVAENVSESNGKLIVSSVNKDGNGREWKLCLVDDDYIV